MKSVIYNIYFFSCLLNLKPVSSGLGVSQPGNLKSEINLSSLLTASLIVINKKIYMKNKGLGEIYEL